MSVHFDVKLSSQDMYRFNLYHAYTSMQGILSIVMGVFIIGVIIVSDQFHSISSGGPYVAIALVFLLYVPITLRVRSKRQILMSEALKNTLHFELNEEGIKVSSNAAGEDATLPWDYVYKAVTTKHNFLIYSNRVNAYVVPKAQVQDVLPQIYDAFEAHCKDFRLKIKR